MQPLPPQLNYPKGINAADHLSSSRIGASWGQGAELEANRRAGLLEIWYARRKFAHVSRPQQVRVRTNPLIATTPLLRTKRAQQLPGRGLGLSAALAVVDGHAGVR